jgi:anaerobic selenocysteine-containing dehydrogenase
VFWEQYNATIYGMNDRYRGIKGRRDVVFVNQRDFANRGLKHGDLVDITVVPDAPSKANRRVMRNLTAIAYNIAQGSIANYYPEANVLVALDHTQNPERRPTNRPQFCSPLRETRSENLPRLKGPADITAPHRRAICVQLAGDF